MDELRFKIGQQVFLRNRYDLEEEGLDDPLHLMDEMPYGEWVTIRDELRVNITALEFVYKLKDVFPDYNYDPRWFSTNESEPPVLNDLF